MTFPSDIVAGGEYRIADPLLFLPDDLDTDDTFRIYNATGYHLELNGGSGQTVNSVSGDHFTLRHPEWVHCKKVSGGYTITKQSQPVVEYVKSPDGTLSAAKDFANVQSYNADELIVIFGCTTASENGLYFRDLSGSTRVWTQVSL